MTNANDNKIPLTYGSDISRWQDLKPYFKEGLETVAAKDAESYADSHKEVDKFFTNNILSLPYPIYRDDEAKEVLDTLYAVEEELIEKNPDKQELYQRTGRHMREHLADQLVKKHHHYLRNLLKQGELGAKQLADNLGLGDRFSGGKSLSRFTKKIQLYLDVGSFVHAPELTLSTVKVKTRSKARADRGNLWPVDRRDKYTFLEKLADEGHVSPNFTEADLEFLVSQSSLDMLKKKTDLLLSEINTVEPNRLKANYSRLKEHLQRSKQRKGDYDRRRELLQKLGATEEQIDYISARATYQTMKNLLKLANGKLAISDLMGGKRTIRKLLRRRGKAQSNAEIQITRYLTKVEGIDRSIASNYARTRKNHSIEHLQKTVDFLKENYRRLYKAHWGFEIRENVLRKALEYGLSRQKLSKRALTTKDFVNDLRRSASQEDARMVMEQDTLNAEARRSALLPLKEVLDYETDTDTRKQLFFIYEKFCDHGLCMQKDKLKEMCLKNQKLFPTPRKVQDALEILNGAYRAIGQHGETVCILPDYLNLPKKKQTSFIKQ